MNVISSNLLNYNIQYFKKFSIFKEVGNEASLIKMGHGGTIDRSAQGVLGIISSQSIFIK